MYYAIVQLVLLPWNVLVALFVGYSREYYKLQTYRQRLKDSSLENLPNNIKINRNARKIDDQRKTFVPSVGNSLFIFGQKMNDSGKFNQDVPLNRFIAFSWSYLFFLMVLISYLLFHEVQTDNNQSQNWNKTNQIILTLYIFSFVLQDVNTIMVHKINAFSSFWRVYDYLWHFLLFSAWVTGSKESYLNRDPFVIGKY